MKRFLLLSCVFLFFLCAFGCNFNGCTDGLSIENSCAGNKKATTRYELNAEFVPDTRSVTGTVKAEFLNGTDDEISTLKFQLYGNAYRKDATYKAVATAYEKSAYYAGESYGETAVTSVNGGRNWQVGGVDKNVLIVDLEYPLYPNEKVVVDIGFVTKLAQAEHRLGVTKRGVNLGNFYPILCGFKNGEFFESVYYADGDPFYSDVADYKVTFALPKEYAVASSCTVIGEKGLESKKEYTMYATNAREIALFAYEKYSIFEAVVKGVRLKYYALNEETAEENFKIFQKSFAYYSGAFGEYPYPECSVAEADFCFGGMEYPALSVISAALSGEDAIRAIAHEVAHQWWYAAVGSDQTQNAWQDEGLAEYSAILFFEKHAEYGLQGEKLVLDSYAAYRAYARTYLSAFGELDTRMSRDLGEYLSEYEYRSVSFDKGVILMDTLRKSVGEKKFFAALKRYYKENLYKIATPWHFIGAFERAGVDVSGLVESFLSGKGII